MIDSKILPDTIYRHKRTGGIYTVKSLGKMKSEEGQWHSCVVYFRKEDSSWFTRDLAHFIENFELVQLVKNPELLSNALKRSMVALDDWLHVHAGDFCDPQDFAESAARIKEVGTVAYIADVQMQNRAALAGTNEVTEVIKFSNDHGQAYFEAGQSIPEQPQQQDDWFKTSAELTAVSYEMDVIHERYSGKEKRAEREELLTPLRLKCREIGERLQLLVTPHKKSPVPDPSHAEIIRLTACLKIANDNAEKFEREWYLRGDEIDAMIAQTALSQQGEAKPAPAENHQKPDHPAFHHDYPRDTLDALHDAFLALPVCPLLAVVGNAIQEIQSLRQPQQTS